MNLCVRKAATLVDDVGVSGVLGESGQPELAHILPEIFVDFVESAIDEGCLCLMNSTGCCKESLG